MVMVMAEMFVQIAAASTGGAADDESLTAAHQASN
jgi:hypothetical protein